MGCKEKIATCAEELLKLSQSLKSFQTRLTKSPSELGHLEQPWKKKYGECKQILFDCKRELSDEEYDISRFRVFNAYLEGK